jgi:hypothetical protein
MTGHHVMHGSLVPGAEHELLSLANSANGKRIHDDLQVLAQFVQRHHPEFPRIKKRNSCIEYTCFRLTYHFIGFDLKSAPTSDSDQTASPVVVFLVFCPPPRGGADPVVTLLQKGRCGLQIVLRLDRYERQ